MTTVGQGMHGHCGATRLGIWRQQRCGQRYWHSSRTGCREHVPTGRAPVEPCRLGRIDLREIRRRSSTRAVGCRWTPAIARRGRLGKTKHNIGDKGKNDDGEDARLDLLVVGRRRRPRSSRLPRPPGGDVGGNRSDADHRHSGDAHARDHHRQRKRQFDAPEYLCAAHTHALRGFDHRPVHTAQAGHDVPHQDELGIDDQRNKGIGKANADDGDQQGKERQAGDGIGNRPARRVTGV